MNIKISGIAIGTIIALHQITCADVVVLPTDAQFEKMLQTYRGLLNVNFNNNNLPHIPVTVNPQLQAELSAVANSKLYNVITNNAVAYAMQYYEKSREKYNEAKNNAHFTLSNIHDYMINHKLMTFIGGTLLTYSFFLGHFVYYGYKAAYRNKWSLWKQSIPTKILVTMPYEQLSQELLIAIQREYHKPDHPHDFLQPLRSFVADIDAEIYNHSHFIYLYKMIGLVRFNRFFPAYTELIAESKDKLNRLLFIKDIFMQWNATYTITSNGITLKRNVAVSQQSVLDIVTRYAELITEL